MIDFLLEVKNEVDKAQGVSFDSTTVKQFEDRYKRIVGEGMKLQQKISETFHSYEGAVSFCRIISYISTVKKQGGNVIIAIQNIFQGNPFLPEINFCTAE